MKSTFAAWAIAAGLVLSTAALAAQDNSTTTQQTTTTTTNDNNATTSQSSSTTTLPDKDSAATPNPSMATTPDTSATATQDATSSTDKSANVRTVTGCLQKADSGNEYQLTGKDGSTWEVRSDAVDLSSHVGHYVTVTGAVRNAGMHGMKEDAKKEASDHGVGASAEHGHMTVTKLAMVSTSCSQ